MNQFSSLIEKSYPHLEFSEPPPFTGSLEKIIDSTSLPLKEGNIGYDIS